MSATKYKADIIYEIHIETLTFVLDGLAHTEPRALDERLAEKVDHFADAVVTNKLNLKKNNISTAKITTYSQHQPTHTYTPLNASIAER